jgi:transketolase
MPGLVILRPADANETVVAWRLALERRDGPTMLLLTRQKVPVLDQKTCAPASNVCRGAYTLLSADEPRVLLIASGSEVHLALKAYAELAAEGIPGRVVSMPSWELFEQQTAEYRARVLPPDITSRVAVEAGVRNGWERYIGDRGRFVGMHSFGASAPVEAVFKGFGITVESVVRAAKESLS